MTFRLQPVWLILHLSRRRLPKVSVFAVLPASIFPTRAEAILIKRVYVENMASLEIGADEAPTEVGGDGKEMEIPMKKGLEEEPPMERERTMAGAILRNGRLKSLQ